MTNPTLTIDTSPPGSWRAEIAHREGKPTACAVCRQSTCEHTDAEYLGPARPRHPQSGDRK